MRYLLGYGEQKASLLHVIWSAYNGCGMVSSAKDYEKIYGVLQVTCQIVWSFTSGIDIANGMASGMEQYKCYGVFQVLWSMVKYMECYKWDGKLYGVLKWYRYYMQYGLLLMVLQGVWSIASGMEY